MKYRFLSGIGALALASAIVIQAQDFDDIYYDGSSSSKVKTEKKSDINVTRDGTTTTIITQKPVTRVAVMSNKNYKADRDVDEYNRRGISEYDPTDTLSYVDDDIAFSNTQRIERFYNPDIVIASNDADLIELYYDDTPTVNLIIGTNYGLPYVSWGFGYSSYWYDPWYSWYDPFYRPWYVGWYRPYYSWGWHHTWYPGWYGWHRPYYGWYRPYYGWSGHHYGWDRWNRPGHHYYGSTHHGRYSHGGYNYGRGRVPGDSRSLLSGRGSRGDRAGISGLNRSNSGSVRGGTMSSGRTRPGSERGSGTMQSGRGRTSTAAIGNVGNRSVRQGSSTATMSGRSSSGSMRNSRSSSSSYSSPRDYSRSSGSTRSYSPRTSSSTSSWGSSHSAGSSRGGGYSGGGGFSGGSRGGYSGGGGGGGGRRH